MRPGRPSAQRQRAQHGKGRRLDLLLDHFEIAGRLERCLDEPFAVEGYVLRGAASVGIAVYPEDGTTRDSLLSAADAAMYVGKHTGRPRPSQLTGRLNVPLTP